VAMDVAMDGHICMDLASVNLAFTLDCKMLECTANVVYMSC